MLTIDEIRAMPGTYLKGELNPGEWAAFWDAQQSGKPGKFIIAQYSHSEVTTPFDRHWTMNREYFAHCALLPVYLTPFVKSLSDAV